MKKLLYLCIIVLSAIFTSCIVTVPTNSGYGYNSNNCGYNRHPQSYYDWYYGGYAPGYIHPNRPLQVPNNPHPHR
jgi:hypothetical protein